MAPEAAKKLAHDNPSRMTAFHPAIDNPNITKGALSHAPVAMGRSRALGSNLPTSKDAAVQSLVKIPHSTPA